MIQRYISHRNAYLLGLIGVAYTLSVSEYALSVCQFFIAANWLIEGKKIERAKAIFKNPSAWMLASILSLSLIGLIHTENFDYALDDLRIKLPLFLLPFLMVGYKALNKNELQLVMAFFALGLMTSSGFAYYQYLEQSKTSFSDIRDISIFISHIRLSLMLVLASFILPYFFWNRGVGWRVISILCSAWFLFMVFVLKSVSGFLVLLIALFVLLAFWSLTTRNQWIKMTNGAIFISIIALSYFYIYPNVKTFIYTDDWPTVKTIPYHTPSQNIYYHDLESGMVENGHKVWVYVCWKELRQEWNKISDIPYDGYDKSGQLIKTTMIRFMASKADPRDSTGISRLDQKQINAIENGETNYFMMDDHGFGKRIYRTAWEIHSYLVGAGNPQGNSAAQRFEFWKTARHVISKNWVFGVGTGDIVEQMQSAYIELESTLAPEYRLKPHNQYLSTWISFGIFGLIWFIIVFIWPLIGQGKERLPYLLFFIIAATSMLTEDTIEGQVGVTFVAFFYCLFTFSLASNKPRDETSLN